MFKNLMVYKMSEEFAISVDALKKDLPSFSFRACSGMDIKSSGWVEPIKNSGELCFISKDQILLHIMTEEKILPAPVIKEFLDDKIERFEEREGRKPKKTEKDSMKDEVIQELIPRAFSKYNKTAIWVNMTNKVVMVEAGSEKKAEDALALLRKTLTSLPVTPYINSPVELTLTEWVTNDVAAEGFFIMDEAELKAILEDGGVIQSKKQDLSSDEIKHHIEAGKQVTKLALNWKEKIDFVFSVDGSIKRIKFSDLVKEELGDFDAEDYAAKFEAEFLLAAGELSLLISDLMKVFSMETEGEESAD